MENFQLKDREKSLSGRGNNMFRALEAKEQGVLEVLKEVPYG